MCKYCHDAPIQFARDKVTDKPNPLEMQTSIEGTLLLDPQRMVYETLKGEDLDRARAQGFPLYRSHGATCTAKPFVARSRYDSLLLGLEEE